jgi:hypothetical protein
MLRLLRLTERVAAEDLAARSLEQRRPLPHVVAAARRLDLHDVGAHVGEQHARKRAGGDLPELEHANAGEWTMAILRHSASSRPRNDGGVSATIRS